MNREITGRLLKGFYENELKNKILPFWLERCEDRVYGGYFNCFNNEGTVLVSHDKYTWSQGRFVWIFSRLASAKAPIFSAVQRKEFLRLAKSGRDFLMRHCLIGEGDYRCVFLMEEDGTPKHVDGCEPLDMSIYADCFVVLAMAAYSRAAGDREAYVFGKRLYGSIRSRIEKNDFYTLPYPLSHTYKAHGIPMILANVAWEMHEAAAVMGDGELKEELLRDEMWAAREVLDIFAGEDGLIREVVCRTGERARGMLGSHINPGHTLEDMWFMLDARELLKAEDWDSRIYEIIKRTLETGWDKEYGGILHYCALDGSQPRATSEDNREEPVVRQVEDGWGDKLWWVQSEALYTTLRSCLKTGDVDFWRWPARIFDYTFSHFPNTDPETGEWTQILKRDGTPQEKVVALPVKDPYHIVRNLLLILELLYGSADSYFPSSISNTHWGAS